MADKQDIEKFSNSVSSFKDTIEKYRSDTGSMGDFGKSVNIFEQSVKSQAATAEQSSKFITSIQSASPNAKTETNIEKSREGVDRENKSNTLLEAMVNGILDLNKSFLDGMKQKAKNSAGIVIALLISGIVAIVSFFKQLAAEFKFLTKFTGGGIKKVVGVISKIGKFFANAYWKTISKPIELLLKAIGKTGPGAFLFDKLRNFVTGIKGFFTSITKNAFIDDIVKNFKGFKNWLGSGITRIAKFLKPVGDFFKSIFKMGKVFVTGSKTATGLLSFAKGFGATLGKLFLPLTIIMGVWDLVTGFIDGFSSTEGDMFNKIVGGLTGGIGKVAKTLIGIPLDLLKSAVKWLGEKMGFDMKFLDSFSFEDIIGDIFDGFKAMIISIKDDVVNGLKGIFKGFTKLFSGDVKGGLGDIVGSIKDILLAPIKGFIKMLEKIFDFDMKSLITSIVPKKLRSMVGLGDDKKSPDAIKEEAEEEKRENERREMAEAKRVDAVKERLEARKFGQKETLLERQITYKQRDVDKDDSKRFILPESKEEQDADRKKLESLQLQLIELRAQRETKLAGGGAVGGGVVVNQDNRDMSSGKNAKNLNGNVSDRHGSKTGSSRK